MNDSSPWVGLAFYTEAERDYFRGRERDARIVAANLRARRLTVLYGPTGVGKTSLLLAGVVPSLRENRAVLVFREWQGESFLEELRRQCAELGREHDAKVDADQPLDELLAAIAHATGAPALVVFDQFEEYFVGHASAANGDGFEPELARAVNRADLDAGFLVSLREDSLASMDRFQLRIPNLLRNLIRLEHLTVEAASAAIRESLATWNEKHGTTAGIEDELLEKLLEDVSPRGVPDGAVETPFLQLVLERMWEDEDGPSPVLTLATYEQLGGATGIVADHFASILDRLTPKQRELCARFFDRLVTPSGGKITYPIADLDELAGELAPEVPDTLALLKRERILRELETSEFKAVEIFHDVLAPTILDWKIEIERRRAQDAERRRRLKLIGLAAVFGAIAIAAVIGFVIASNERGHARSEARQARARELEATASASLSYDPRGSLVAALEAARLEPSARAEGLLRTALISSRLRASLGAAGPVETAVFSPDGRTILAAGGSQARLYEAADDRLLHVLPTSARVTAAAFVGDDRAVTGAADGTTRLWNLRSGRGSVWLDRRPGPVTSISNPGNGTLLVTWGRGSAILASPSGVTTELAEKDPIARGALDPSGRFAATVARDRQGHVQARLYDAASGKRLRILPVLGVTDARFDSTGSLLAVASHKGTTLWNLRRPLAARPLTLDDGGSASNTAAFDPTGTYVATAGVDGQVGVFDVAGGGRVYRLGGDAGHVVALAWTSDGRTLAAASTGHTARLWDIAGRKGSFVAALMGSLGPLTSIAFSPDGRFLVTGSADEKARLYDAHVDEDLDVVGRQPGVAAVAASPGGLIAAVASNGMTKIWDARSHRLRYASAADETGSGGPVAVAFSDDGKTLMTAAGQTVTFRDPDHPQRRTQVHTAAPIVAARLSSDGGHLVVAAGDNLQVWRLQDLKPVLQTRIPLKGKATAAAVSADGTRVAATAANGSAGLWSADGEILWRRRVPGPIGIAIAPDNEAVAVAGAHGATYLRRTDGSTRLLRAPAPRRVTALAFSPDSTMLLTTWQNGDARLWSVESGLALRDLVGQSSNIADAAFSADGRWIATAGPVTVALWSARSGEVLYFLRGPRKQVRSVVFGPRAGDVAAASDDGTVRTYHCRFCGGLDALTAQAEAQLTRPGG